MSIRDQYQGRTFAFDEDGTASPDAGSCGVGVVSCGRFNRSGGAALACTITPAAVATAPTAAATAAHIVHRADFAAASAARCDAPSIASKSWRAAIASCFLIHSKAAKFASPTNCFASNFALISGNSFPATNFSNCSRVCATANMYRLYAWRSSRSIEASLLTRNEGHGCTFRKRFSTAWRDDLAVSVNGPAKGHKSVDHFVPRLSKHCRGFLLIKDHRVNATRVNGDAVLKDDANTVKCARRVWRQFNSRLVSITLKSVNFNCHFDTPLLNCSASSRPSRPGQVQA